MRKIGKSSYIFTLLSFAIFGSAASLSRLPESDAELYTFASTVSLNEVNTRRPQANDIAFKIEGNVLMSRVWQNAVDPLEKLYYVRLSSLKTLVKKNRNESSNFEQESIKLDELKNDPFLVHWNNYHVEGIYLNEGEETFVKNLKKAIANTFQFRDSYAHVEEVDICGICSVIYEVIDSRTILKHKKNCVSHLPVNQNAEKIFGAEKKTDRRVMYQLNEHSNIVKITSYEIVELSLSIKKEIGFSIIATLDLNYVGTDAHSISMLPGNSIVEAVEEFKHKFNIRLVPDVLYATEESLEKEEKSQLSKILKENREYLKSNNLGTYKSAMVFIETLKVVLESSETEIIKTLKNKKNEPILNQLMDILGCAQTLEAHNAVLKTFNFVQPKNIDPLERYLWSISVGRKSKIEFFEDLKIIVKKGPTNKKLKETLILTLTALARKFSQEIISEAFTLVSDGMSACSAGDEDCIACYLRALKNLKISRAKPMVIKYAETGSRKLSVTALKVLYSYPPSEWDDEILKVAEKIYFQKDKIYDSSARTIAVDIIIDSNPNLNTLRVLLKSLKTNTSFETRKYLLQRLQQTASMNESFNQQLSLLMNEENLNNYNFLAQRGMSNALTKMIFKDTNLNVSLFTINEISKSVLKRSQISVTLGQEDHVVKVCALDLFTGGLSSFLWSEDVPGEEELEEAEDLVAGIELTIYGVTVRPFIFFNGHGELMGHIWAGTASERTPALQAMSLLQEHNEQIALATGNVIKFDLIGGSSFELAGKVDFSIWNRNAKTNMDAKVGVITEGSVSVNTFFMKNNVDFRIYSEQKVDVMANLDFYDEILFCLQISQMETNAKCDVNKIQNVADTDHWVHRTKQKQLIIPGRTFALNRMNNEMCNKIFKPS